jgi:ElaB/YqjD/DUF883 family membrane-anchored ribosome-binding protein
MIIKIEKKARKAGRAADNIADDARSAISRATDRAADTYATAREMAESVDPFVKDRPYLSLAFAAIAGLVIGGLFLPPVPKVVYVKSRD